MRADGRRQLGAQQRLQLHPLPVRAGEQRDGPWERIDSCRVLDDGKHVFYLDIGPKFTQPDGSLSKDIMPDLLHLSEKGYEIWARSIESTLARLMPD